MKHGHLPLRLLSPYHPDLNPIELVWGEMASQNIGSSSLEHKEQLLRKLFSKYSPEKWKKCCEHVRKIEEKYCEDNGIVDSEVNTS